MVAQALSVEKVDEASAQAADIVVTVPSDLIKAGSACTSSGSSDSSSSTSTSSSSSSSSTD